MLAHALHQLFVCVVLMILAVRAAARVAAMAQNLVCLRHVSFESQLSNDNIIGDQIRLGPGVVSEKSLRLYNEVGDVRFYAHNNSYACCRHASRGIHQIRGPHCRTCTSSRTSSFVSTYRINLSKDICCAASTHP